MRLTLALLGALAAGAGAPDTGAPDAGPTPAPDAPSCIAWRSEARYRNYGYDHIVEIRNGCSAAAECQVTTNVAPEPVGVRVGAGQTVEVLTFRGSPASAFKARVRCGLKA